MKKDVKGNDPLRFRGQLTLRKLVPHPVKNKAAGTDSLVSDGMERQKRRSI